MKGSRLGIWTMALAIALMLAPGARAAESKAVGANKTVAIIVAEDEYKANQTMPPFGKMLSEKYGFRCEYMVEPDMPKDAKKHDVPNMEKLKDADLAIVYVRRRPLPEQQLQLVRAHLESGKPLIGIRTASHAFASRKADDPAAKGLAQWRDFDQAVLGCNYNDHYKETKDGTAISIIPEKKSHPILAGVAASFKSEGTLYRIAPLTPTAEALMMGSIAGKPAEPVLVTNTYKNGGRIVYTTLGHPADFKNPSFEKMLVNSVFWALKLEAPKD